ncbi:MAG: NAD(P)H-dependent oxidoreductase subunit E [Burkholderiaceae bacterium]|nr:MAG: NAD(P)H-dependent oxidoreductase subunit E [Burkholderiaceae bacterium]
MKKKLIHNKGLSEESYKLIDKEIEKFPPAHKKSAVVAALAIAQREHGFVNQELEREIADYLGMEEISVHEILTFYNMFNKEGTGKYKISVCTNLPCALRNSRYTVDFLKELLGVEVGETTKDGLFTLLEGECFGACADAPVLLLNNDQMHSWMDKAKCEKLISELKEERLVENGRP